MKKRGFFPGATVVLLLIALGMRVSALARQGNLVQPRAPVSSSAAPAPPPDFLLETTFSKTEFYAGEAITLTITCYQATDAQNAVLDIPVPEGKGGGFDLSDAPDTCRPPAQCRSILLGRNLVMAEKSARVIHGKTYAALSFEKILVARRAGTYEFPGASLALRVSSYEKTKANLNPSGPGFLEELYTPGTKVVRNITVKSRVEKLRVMALPERGRPAGFSGPAGKFRLNASISSPKVVLGSPITLTMVVRGSGRPQDVPPPVLSKVAGLIEDYELPGEMASGTPGDGCKMFKQTLWPKFAGKGIIPAINYQYFDPDEGRYRTASSGPIPVEVTPAAGGEEGLLYQASLFGADTMRYGIAQNYEDPVVIGERDTLSATVGSPAWVCSVAFPPAVFLVFFFWRRVSRKSAEDVATIRSAKAYTVFCRQVGRKSFPGNGQEGYLQLTLLMKNFLADKFNMPGDNLTSSDFMLLLLKKGVDERRVGRLRSVFEACERRLFGGASRPDGAMDELVKAAREVFSEIDRQIG